MDPDGSDGLGTGYGGFDGPSTSGVDLSGQAPDYSGSFMSTADLPGIDGISSLGAGLLDVGQYTFEPSLVNDYSPANLESTMSMSDLPGIADDGSLMGQLAKMARAYMNFSKTVPGQIANFALTKANPVAGMISGIARAGYAASQSPAQAGRAIGGMAGGQLGSMFGPAGAFAGNQIGGQIGQSMLGGLNQGYSGPSMGNQPGQEGGIGLGTGGLLGLAALYQGSRNAREIGGQMSSLQSLYGANSPFAQQAMQAIQRKGAQGGRRTSGNRADAAGLTQNQVQLQSLLAQNAARLAPTLAQMQTSRQNNRGQTLAQLAGLYQQMGGMQGIRSGLDQLFAPHPFLQDLQGPSDGLSGLSGGGLSTGTYTGDPTEGYDFPSFDFGG